jgi:hypothetical protein
VSVGLGGPGRGRLGEVEPEVCQGQGSAKSSGVNGPCVSSKMWLPVTGVDPNLSS